MSGVRQRRTFHARWSAKRGWWDLYCRRCKTTEEIPAENLPQNVAQVHAQWWHRTPVNVPSGWANPGAPASRMCNHRQCPPYECRGC